ARITENVERGAPQAAQLRQQLECGEYPCAVLALAQLTGSTIALGEERRRQVEMKLVVAFELGSDLLHECRIGVQARHFVFVLVGKQFEKVAGYGFGESAESFRTRRLRLLHPVDQGPVFVGVRRILITGQKL